MMIRVLVQINYLMWIFSVGFILDLDSRPLHISVLLGGLFVSAILELVDVRMRR